MLVIIAEQHRLQIPRKESGKRYAFCFYAVGLSTVIFRWWFFEKGTKYGEEECFRYLLKIIRCFGMWPKYRYFKFIF